MASKIILLVEDNPDDETLTLRALRKNNVENEVIVARDGVEALDFLFCTGAYVDRDPNNIPEVILLDLRLPKVDGLEVLRHIRANEQTKRLPVIVLTLSNADQDLDSLNWSCTPAWSVFASIERVPSALEQGIMGTSFLL